jgi:hypothetical protein
VITHDGHGVAQRSSDDGRDSAPAALAESLGPRLGPAVTFATTEHFNLQTARAVTVSEANGRASIYLAALAVGADPLAVPLVCGAAIGGGAFSLHERHHRRARNAWPEAVDRAAIVSPPSKAGRRGLKEESP